MAVIGYFVSAYLFSFCISLKQNLEQNKREKKTSVGFDPGAYAWLRELYIVWLPYYTHFKIC